MQRLLSSRRRIVPLSLFVAGLCWLWLTLLVIPMGSVLGLLSVEPLVLFTAFLFVCDSLLGAWWLRVPAKLVVLVFFLYRYYYKWTGFFSLNWIKSLFHDTVTAFVKMGTPGFDLSTGGQMLLLLVVLWLAGSVFYGSLRYRWAVFTMLILGEGVLGFFDAFYTVTVNADVFFYLLIGFLLLAAAQFGWLSQVVTPEERLIDLSEWFGSAIVIGALIGIVGLASPKQLPSWPDPVTWWNAFGQGIGNGFGHHRVGYGNDDSYLGGPFEQDDTITMTATEPQQVYLRGESKDVYTGHGWISGDAQIIRGTPGHLPFAQMSQDAGLTGVPMKSVQVTINVKSGSYGLFFSPYQAQALSDWSQHGQKVADFAPFVDLSGYRLVGGPIVAGDSYTVTAEVPTSDAAVILGKVPYVPPSQYPKSVQKDLQLPDTVPVRVKTLAQQVVNGLNGTYDKAEAVAQYLRQNYDYQTQDVPAPGPGQDFVDQFLYQSKRGYCDQFSSAMVVMMRELGIPARWVKGFASGQIETSTLAGGSASGDLYNIEEKDAHSWVEVYFQGYGWFPFDPTPTFSLPLAYSPTALGTDKATALPDPTQIKTQKTEKGLQEQQATAAVVGKVLWIVGLLAALAVLALGSWLVTKRRELLTSYRMRKWSRYARKSVDRALVRSVLYLVGLLERFGIKRHPSSTLREFWQQFFRQWRGEREHTTPVVRDLTVLFEEVRYGEREMDSQREETAVSSWKHIVAVLTKGGRRAISRRLRE